MNEVVGQSETRSCQGEKSMVESDNQKLYRVRFDERDRAAKADVWRVIVERFLQRWVSAGDTVLDLGCGYGEFLNHLRCARRIGVDLNPDSADWYRVPSEQCSGPGIPAVEVRGYGFHEQSTGTSRRQDGSREAVDGSPTRLETRRPFDCVGPEH